MNSSRTRWMQEARWGVFIHFLATPPSSIVDRSISAEEWNATVDAFDTEGLADQLEAARVPYLYLTIGQCSGHFCAPNATYARLTGSDKCSRRDLMLDMYESLSKRRIKLLAYLPSHAPCQDPEATRRLRFVPPWDYTLWNPLKGGFRNEDSIGIDERVIEGQRNWEAVIREWSQRWGDKVTGWWFDGCYFADKMYRHPEAPNFQSFAAAARAGNPRSIVAWNPGVCNQGPVEMDVEEDYTAGEINDPWKPNYGGYWKGREHFHLLTFLGKFWCTGPVRFSAREAAALVHEVNTHGGTLTWDLPIEANGLIEKGAFEVVRHLECELTRSKFGNRQPSIEVSVTETPTRSVRRQCTPGIVTMKLSNPWKHSITGQINLNSSPQGSLQLHPSSVIDYTLQPSDSEFRNINISLAPELPYGSFVQLTIDRENQLPPSRMDIPIQYELQMPIPLLIIQDQGEALAEIEMQWHGDILHLNFTIVDAIVKRASVNPWEGSCMEMFVAPNQGVQVEQYFFLPDTPSGNGQIIRQNGFAEAPEGMTYATRPTPNGYQGSATVALSWLLRLEQAPPSFLIAFSITTGARTGGFKRAQLFGSENTFQSTLGYALVKPPLHSPKTN